MALNINVLGNILEFLGRVELKGVEAFAFVEAYSAVQGEREAQKKGPGLPFDLGNQFLDSLPVGDGPKEA